MNFNVDNQVRFSRELNLLDKSDLVDFIQETKNAGYRLLVGTEKELQELIKFGCQVFPDSAYYIRNGCTQIYVSSKFSISYDFFNIILPLTSFLYKFRKNKDFINKVKVNTINLVQLDDTIFELMCLKQFYENDYGFEYEPKVIVKGKGKKSDFRLIKNDLDIFVECKQVRVGQSRGEVNFIKNYHYAQQKFPEDIIKRLVNKNLRLEVNFIKMPSKKELNILVEKLCPNFEKNYRLNETPIKRITENLEYTILHKSEPSGFSSKSISMKAGLLVVGTQPTIIHNQDNINIGGICFYSNELFMMRRRTIVNLIREANNQLPDNKHGIIILGKVNKSIAKQDIEKRMNGNQYTNILAFIVNPFEDFWSCYRTQHQDLLFGLFKGFQPQNPFKQK